jgi:DNA-binding NarL/FixJ family response regulator
VSGPITCVVADDHPMMRDMLAAVLTAGDIQVLGAAADGKEALELIRRHRPRVAVVDLRMPVLDGAEVAIAAAQAVPETAVVVFTACAERGPLLQALDAGVLGFVLKEAPGSELVRAVTMAAEGRLYLDPTLGWMITRGTTVDGGATLTDRQRSILRLLSTGLSTEQVGAALFIAPETVRVHIRNARIALKAETPIHAVVTALRQELIP